MAKKKTTPKKLGGPFIAAAVFCENMFEADDKSMNAIRIHDGTTIGIPHEAPPDVPSKEMPVPVHKKMLVAFRTGDASGDHRFQIVAESPSGKRNDMLDRTITLGAHPHTGLNIKTEMMLTLHLAGVYWFDIIIDGKVLTRVPLNILFERLPAPTPEESETRSSLEEAKTAKAIRKR